MNMQNEDLNKERRNVIIEDNRLQGSVLFAENNELIIVHNEQEYRLRITGNNKLILTK